MTEKKKIQIAIDGRNFTVIGTEPEEYVRKIADYVDSKIKEVTSKNDRLGQIMATTLAALNISDELHKTKERLMELERRAKDPMERYDDVIEELEKAKNIIKKLEGECSSYKEQVEKLQSELDEAQKEKEKLNQALELKEKELLENQKMIKSLQDKIFDSQIELIETKKELGELLRRFDDSKNLFSKEDA